MFLQPRRRWEKSMREITLSKAVNEAIAEEMRRDETIFCLGKTLLKRALRSKYFLVLSKNLGRIVLLILRLLSPGLWA